MSLALNETATVRPAHIQVSRETEAYEKAQNKTTGPIQNAHKIFSNWLDGFDLSYAKLVFFSHPFSNAKREERRSLKEEGSQNDLNAILTLSIFQKDPLQKLALCTQLAPFVTPKLIKHRNKNMALLLEFKSLVNCGYIYG
jgi:hypothetical protein